jgi:hypothetical protein
LEKKLDRRIFENALATMQKYGVDSLLTAKIYPKRNKIKESLISYYESTEEFEKCTYIMEFFKDLEVEGKDTMLYNDIVGATGENKSDDTYIF